MTKTKSISIRLSSETEHKLNWLIKETNTGDIAYKPQTMSDIIERCIHNEWVSINMANFAWRDEEIMVDEEYINLMKKKNRNLTIRKTRLYRKHGNPYNKGV